MVHDPDKIEDVLKVDATNGDPDTGDDTYDMIRYAMMSRPPITDAPIVKHKYGSEEWAKQQVQEMEEKAEDHFRQLEEAAKGYGL